MLIVLNSLFSPLVLTLFSVLEGRTVEILLHYFPSLGRTVNIVLRSFPSLRYLTFTRGHKQYAHYETPEKRCELKKINLAKGQGTGGGR